MEKSNCFEESNLNILRGEAYCFIDFIYRCPARTVFRFPGVDNVPVDKLIK